MNRETQAERRERLERERSAGLAFSRTLREDLEAKRIRALDLEHRGQEKPEGEGHA